jgi:hypothetical protein
MNQQLFGLCLCVAVICAACAPNLDRLLPREGNRWLVSALSYEYIQASDRIDRLDTVDYGQLVFLDNGQANLYAFDNDTLLLDDLAWLVPNQEEITLRFTRESFGGEQEFTFRVLESQRKRQLWRAEKRLTVYDVLRRDSVEARVLLQLSLDQAE